MNSQLLFNIDLIVSSLYFCFLAIVVVCIFTHNKIYERYRGDICIMNIVTGLTCVFSQNDIPFFACLIIGLFGMLFVKTFMYLYNLSTKIKESKENK